MKTEATMAAFRTRTGSGGPGGRGAAPHARQAVGPRRCQVCRAVSSSRVISDARGPGACPALQLVASLILPGGSVVAGKQLQGKCPASPNLEATVLDQEPGCAGSGSGSRARF